MQQTLDLSPLGLFLDASLMGKAVMAVLFLASLWSWVLIIEGRVSVDATSQRGSKGAGGRGNAQVARRRRRRGR